MATSKITNTQAQIDALNASAVKNADNAKKVMLQQTNDGRLAVYVNGSWVGTIVYDSHP